MKHSFDDFSFSESPNLHQANKDTSVIVSGQFGKAYIIVRGIGMDGAEIISDLVATTIKGFFEKLPQKYDSLIALRQGIQLATKEVMKYTTDHKWLSKCGASVAILLSNISGTHIATAGDCRVLLMRRNRISCICPKTSHWSLDTAGVLNTIGLTLVEPEVVEDIKVYRDDCILLTTKGVYQRVTRQEIVKALGEKSLKDGIRRLWHFAKNKKSSENFTIIALRAAKASSMPALNTTTEKDIVSFMFLLILLAISVVAFYLTFYPYLNDLRTLLH